MLCDAICIKTEPLSYFQVLSNMLYIKYAEENRKLNPQIIPGEVFFCGNFMYMSCTCINIDKYNVFPHGCQNV